MKIAPYLLLALLAVQCKTASTPPQNLQETLADVEKIKGRPEYIESPYVTAGDRVYMVGHQDGSFPDLGWHITGEMGGIWDHPIKLMDGFSAQLTLNSSTLCLSKADTFYNYPFANQHVYLFPKEGIRVERLQFVPDGKEAVVVQYAFHNSDTREKKITFQFSGKSDLRPTWLSERTNTQDGNDQATFDTDSNAWVVKDSLNEWFVTFGSTLAPVKHTTKANDCTLKSVGKGINASLTYELTLPANGSIVLPFTIAGSYESKAQAQATLEEVQEKTAELFSAKKKRYAELASQTQISIPDKDVQQAFNWLKYSTDWLVRDVPSVGRGLAAGLPDYPWWFGVDNEYSLQGALLIGRFDIVYKTIELLVKESNRINKNSGRILHEMSTNGQVFNEGNINETPQFATLIWTVYQWTGDKEFLAKYYPVVVKGLDWLMKENDKDGNFLPDGFGMMEIHGLNSEMIDVAAYSQKAFADAAQMAKEMGDVTLVAKYQNIAQKIKDKINTEFWVPESQSYADFIGTKEQTLHLIDDAIVRADTLKKPWAVAEMKALKEKVKSLPAGTKKGFVLHHNWVVNTPMEMGIADSDKALKALETGQKFVNPFGMFVTGIDRDESAGKDVSSAAKGKKTFTYTGAVMTLPTGVQAISENNYGRPDQALDYLKRMTRAFSFALPGSMYEVSPDFGMFAQAWTLYSFGVPIVRQFFGIQPNASHKIIRIQPQFPSSWDKASVGKLTIGDNQLTVHFEKSGNKQTIRLTQTKPDWKIVFALPKGKYKSWEVNSKKVTATQEGSLDVSGSNGEKIVLEAF